MSLLGQEIILKFPFWTFWSLSPKAKLHSSLASFSYFVVSGVKSSRSSVSVAAAKRRPFSAHSLTAQPKTWNKSPPAFDSNNTAAKRQQLDVIERDLKRTTKALQDRLGISKQGFVWNQIEKNVFLQNEQSITQSLHNDRCYLSFGLVRWVYGFVKKFFSICPGSWMKFKWPLCWVSTHLSYMSLPY